MSDNTPQTSQKRPGAGDGGSGSQSTIMKAALRLSKLGEPSSSEGDGVQPPMPANMMMMGGGQVPANLAMNVTPEQYLNNMNMMNNVMTYNNFNNPFMMMMGSTTAMEMGAGCMDPAATMKINNMMAGVSSPPLAHMPPINPYNCGGQLPTPHQLSPTTLHGSTKSFPETLYKIIASEEYTHIISWLPHGRGFTIHDKQRFSDIILPRYFDGAKFTSFTRRLKRWNFVRVPRGPEMGAYYNPNFIRGRPELVVEMRYKMDGFDEAKAKVERARIEESRESMKKEGGSPLPLPPLPLPTGPIEEDSQQQQQQQQQLQQDPLASKGLQSEGGGLIVVVTAQSRRVHKSRPRGGESVVDRRENLHCREKSCMIC